MSLTFYSVAIVGKYMDAQALQSMQADLNRLAQHLLKKNIQLCVETQTAQYLQTANIATASLQTIGHKAQLVIVMGGDGTMLSVARALSDVPVPLVGINRGRLGFLTDLNTDYMLAGIDCILAGEYQLESRMLLQAKTWRGEQLVAESITLNDVVIKSALRLMELEVRVNGLFVSRQRSDGLILATPTGTTAYALSSGGPIMHPDLDAISIVPISPHTLSYRPITVTSESEITVTVVNVVDANISFDGQGQYPLAEGDCIHVQRAKQEVHLLHPKDYSYFDMLRNKLNWG